MRRDSKIHFATNRQERRRTSTDPADLTGDFNRTRERHFRVGEATISLDGDWRTDDDWRFGRYTLYGQRSGGRRTREVRGSEALLPAVRDRLRAHGSDALIFIHGFANDFENTIRRAAQLEIAYASETRAPVVLPFAWPSDGRSFFYTPYFSDRKDAKASGLAMARALERIVTFMREMLKRDAARVMTPLREHRPGDVGPMEACGQRINLMAHSMGNWALANAVDDVQDAWRGRNPLIFGDVFLMAADADADALQPGGKLHPLTRMADRIHVYHAWNDQALWVSDGTKGNPDRLGGRGPADWSALPENVYAVDCSEVSWTGGLTDFDARHQYYRLRDEVIEDVNATLDGAPPDRPGRESLRPGRAWRLTARS